MSDASVQHPAERTARFPRIAIIAAAVLLLALAVASAWWFFRRPSPVLTDKDTVVLADFTNTTGEPVFDGALRQGLSVQLEQSPFLSLISDERVRQTLGLMSQPPDARLTPEIARQLCLRTASTAVLDGSIAKLGTQYVLGLRAINCSTGDSLAEEQLTAEGKEQVLKALAEAAASLRAKLGESLGTVQKFNTPVEQVTTPSLDALQAYSLGRLIMVQKEDHVGAVPLFERAIELDPNFAMAYASLGIAHGHRSERQSSMYFQKAYELRDRVSERERYYIEAHYHASVTGNWIKAAQVYELWGQSYPRDDIAHLNLAGIYLHLGEFEKSRVQAAESLRLLPSDCLSYAHVLAALIAANHLDEARAMAEAAQQKNLDCHFLPVCLYQLAFLQNDPAAMARAANLAAGKWDVGIGDLEAITAAYYGHLRQARALFRRAITSAQQSESHEIAAWYAAKQAEYEALFGNADTARKRAAEALALSMGRDARGIAAVTLAFAGDVTGAQSLAEELAKRLPEDTLVQYNYLPNTRARLALLRKDPSQAITALEIVTPYEFGMMSRSNALCSVFVRGQAYLMARQGREAAAEFQKILDHRSVVLNEPIGALAHLGLARAYVLQDDTTKARAAYQDFLTLWKDADPDIPVLKQAKTEYVQLH